MKRRVSVFLLAFILLVTAIPFGFGANAAQMREGVPVWNEETVKAYTLSFIRGEDLDTLWGYYDLQIRRYLPMSTFVAMLTEIHWMTGDFIQFGTYTSFQETNLASKTHVLHLCMEKQDLDLYFTHKDKKDDWEVMAVEFALSNKQTISGNRDMLVVEDGEDMVKLPAYTEVEVTVGTAPYELKGILTLPKSASPENKVPACVLVHGAGPQDMDETVGEIKFFANVAHALGEKGIATLRYDKRTHAYGDAMTEDEIANMTVAKETVQDAISAGKLLRINENIDPKKIILFGHGLGASMAPRIATEADGVFGGLLMVAGTPKTPVEMIILDHKEMMQGLSTEERAAAREELAVLEGQARALGRMKEEQAKETSIAGVNAYYFWEMQRHDPIKLLKRIRVPVYITQGGSDFQISLANGIEAYEDSLGNMKNVTYKTYPGLNHMLARYTGEAAFKGTMQEYDTPAILDPLAAQEMAAWIKNIGDN